MSSAVIVKTSPVLATASSTPASAGPANTAMLSIPLATAFAAVSSSGVRARPGQRRLRRAERASWRSSRRSRARTRPTGRASAKTPTAAAPTRRSASTFVTSENALARVTVAEHPGERRDERGRNEPREEDEPDGSSRRRRRRRRPRLRSGRRSVRRSKPSRRARASEVRVATRRPRTPRASPRAARRPSHGAEHLTGACRMKEDEGRFRRTSAVLLVQNRALSARTGGARMSDETAQSEEVEAHGPFSRGASGRGPVAEGAAAEASDDEPDVEAHGPLAEGPVGRGASRGGPSPSELTATPTAVRGPGGMYSRPGLFSSERSERVARARRGARSPPRAARPRARPRRSRGARRPRARRPPSPRSRSASRAFSRRSTAIAAWFAKRPSSSISWRLKSVCSGRSRTESTPSAPSSCSSGAAISPFGT